MGVESRRIINNNINSMTRADFDRLTVLQHKALMYNQDIDDVITYYNRYVGSGLNLAGCASCGGSDKLSKAKQDLMAWFNSHKTRLLQAIEEQEKKIVEEPQNPAV